MTRVIEYLPDHHSAVVELMAELQEHERSLSSDRTPGSSMAERHFDYLRETCRTKSGKVFVALDDDAVAIGFVVVFLEAEDDDDLHLLSEYKRFGWVSDLFVKPQHRGLGAAAKLMRRAEEHCASVGVRRVKLAALHDNELAERFYESSGYRKHEVIYAKDLP